MSINRLAYFLVVLVVICLPSIAVAECPNGAGIIALDCYASPGLSIGDAATDLVLRGGGIQVNSSAADAFYTNRITVYDPIPAFINVHGGVIESRFPEDLYAVTTLGGPQMPDPLCPDAQCDGIVAGSDCLPVPAFGPPIQTETVRGSTDPCVPKTIGPGYYPGGIELRSADETLYLEPGIYILDAIGADRGGLYMTGGNLFGEDVMFYITGDGRIDVQYGTVVLNQENEFKGYPFAPFEGMTIYQDRNNLNDARINGTNNLDIGGTLYFPRNHVNITGTGNGFGTQLIANTIEIGGTGTIEINYDGRNPFVGEYLPTLKVLNRSDNSVTIPMFIKLTEEGHEGIDDFDVLSPIPAYPFAFSEPYDEQLHTDSRPINTFGVYVHLPVLGGSNILEFVVQNSSYLDHKRIIVYDINDPNIVYEIDKTPCQPTQITLTDIVNPYVIWKVEFLPVLPGDIAGQQGIGTIDGVVDSYDIQCLGQEWLQETLPEQDWLWSDLNYDRITNFDDFSIQAANWLNRDSHLLNCNI